MQSWKFDYIEGGVYMDSLKKIIEYYMKKKDIYILGG